MKSRSTASLISPQTAGATSPFVNVAARLATMAKRMPDAVAVAEPTRWGKGKAGYGAISFAELDRDSDIIAAALRRRGAGPGVRLALLVPPSIDFVSLVFALLKSGAVTILIDPGMGRKNLVRCLAEASPDGFVAIPVVQAARTILRSTFSKAQLNITVGRRWFWGGPTLAELRAEHETAPIASTQADDPAAIIFTTGSTGPPKGVLYTHRVFDQQVAEIRDFYDIQPGEIDLPCFPLFGLFNGAMGVTTVLPRMNPTRPARVNPRRIVQAVEDWQIGQSFGSPAVWNRVGQYCEKRQIRLPSLRRVLSAGAPVPAHVLKRMADCIHPEGEVHTPYGATEALPVASIAASEVLHETAERTATGGGVCVGRRFPHIEWKVIRITDRPLPNITDVEELAVGQIGELIVRGPVVTTQYVTRVEHNRLTKIADPAGVWHRMGDVGYLDPQERFWFCGRMAHRVLAPWGVMYTIPCEAIFNRHERVFRSALVGVGRREAQRPVIVIEPQPGSWPRSAADRKAFLEELVELGRSSPLTRPIQDFLLHPSLPVDIRHNAKIFREQLAVWAAKQVKRKGGRMKDEG